MPAIRKKIQWLSLTFFLFLLFLAGCENEKPESEEKLIWRKLKTGTDQPLEGICFTGSTGYAVGDHDVILKSTNGGVSWTKKSMGINVDFDKVLFLDPETGFIIGHAYQVPQGTTMRIYKTADGGDTWSEVLNYPAYMNKLYFVNNATGFAIGNSIYKTSDTGNTWIDKLNRTDCSIVSIFFHDLNKGFAFGRCNMHDVMLKTTDGGESWTEKQVNPQGYYSLQKICIVDSLMGYALGGLDWYSRDGSALKTLDGFNSWQNTFYNPKYVLTDLYFLDSMNGYLVGADSSDFETIDDGIILKTKDGGLNWSVTKIKDSGTLFSIHFPDENTGYVTGDMGTILKTTTGGE
jgi:photosystem II stability/assembly factor-like uncharacterized protein